MKNVIGLAILVLVNLNLLAQVKSDDFGRIVLNAYLPEDMPVPVESRNALTTKLTQLTAAHGLAGSQSNPRFIITCRLDIGTKDIIPGPPQMIAQNLSATFYVGDAMSNTIFSTTSLNLMGVGTNENKALIEAFKGINPKTKEFAAFIEEGKNKIIEYYTTNCDFLIKEARTLAGQQKFDEAIFRLSQVPDVCRDCYFRCLDSLGVIYQKKIDTDCSVKFKEAKTLWAAAQNPEGAERAGDVLATIDPLATCQSDVDAFVKSIEAKLKADERARWQFKMRQYADKVAAQKERVRIAEEKSKRDDVYRENQAQRDASFHEKQSQRNFELDKVRIGAYREVAVAYAKNQPKSVTYNNIYWR